MRPQNLPRCGGAVRRGLVGVHLKSAGHVVSPLESVSCAMRALLEVLVSAAEKGAQIARVSHAHRVSKQEKYGVEANPRYNHDFKTLADILVQETVRRDLLDKFPSLINHVLGEESNTFNNSRGESVCVELQETEEGTAQLLAGLVEPDVARDLARVAHAPVKSPDLSALPANCPKLDINNVGIWIDPIDCTSEFINGDWGIGPGGVCCVYTGRALVGLPCVTVLIGAFLRNTGDPIMGVINQPFYTRADTRSVWGVCHGGVRCSNVGPPAEPTGAMLVSGVEGSIVVYRLMSAGYTTSHPPGAGHKLLMVATGTSDGYVLSRDTSFRWDTCGPHAILRALGGDVLTFSPPHLPVLYNQEGTNETEEGVMRFVNRGGIIAFRNPETFEKLKNALY